MEGVTGFLNNAMGGSPIGFGLNIFSQLMGQNAQRRKEMELYRQRVEAYNRKMFMLASKKDLQHLQHQQNTLNIYDSAMNSYVEAQAKENKALNDIMRKMEGVKIDYVKAKGTHAASEQLGRSFKRGQTIITGSAGVQTNRLAMAAMTAQWGTKTTIKNINTKFRDLMDKSEIDNEVFRPLSMSLGPKPVKPKSRGIWSTLLPILGTMSTNMMNKYDPGRSNYLNNSMLPNSTGSTASNNIGSQLGGSTLSNFFSNRSAERTADYNLYYNDYINNPVLPRSEYKSFQQIQNENAGNLVGNVNNPSGPTLLLN